MKLEEKSLLNTDPNLGLSSTKANEIIKKFGFNELQEVKKKSLVIKFLEQFKNSLIIILIFAAILSVIVNKENITEGIIILMVVLINASLGVFQEAKAEKSLDALKKLSSVNVKVIRDGNKIMLDAKFLVPGDLLIVEAGDYIGADALIIEANNLMVNESTLTGESVPVDKNSDEIEETNILGEQKNRLFSGTFVTNGSAKAIVTKTGMKTEVGKIANLLQSQKFEITPLQIKLAQIGRVIGFFAIIICMVVFLIEWLVIYPDNIMEAIKSAIALAVAAIPEGLATIVVVILSIGVQKMAKQNAIIKKLPAVETLGSTSIVCSDKTGTLTQNKMTVVTIYKNELKDINKSLTDSEKEMLLYFSICTSASVTEIAGVEVKVGDPTEIALIDANNNYGLSDEGYKQILEIPFDSDRKMMSVVVNYKERYFLITKGAFDQIIKVSKNVDQEAVEAASYQMATKALRVLGLGIKKLDNIPTNNNLLELENDLEFIGLVGLIDPPREEVKAAIKLANQAGVRTIMITGDHVVTATAIANDLGILESGYEVISSEELNNLSDEQLETNIEKYSVYARVSPYDKVRIVKAWQSKNKVVAMTGDGVNDSPALKTADIGCAMGITGTDVAKEASSMILVDDNFTTIITAIKQGRGIYTNIKKAVEYLLSSNIGEVITIFLASIITAIFSKKFNFGIPLLPIHLLWINLITDTLPAFGLGFEEVSDDVMRQKPRDKNESFFGNNLGKTIIVQGIIVGIITLIAYSLGLLISSDQKVARTMAFLTLSLIQLFHAFNLKSSNSVFSKQVFDNKFLNWSFIVGVILQIGIIYINPVANIFQVIKLNLLQLVLCICLSFLIVIIVEVKKLINIKSK